MPPDFEKLPIPKDEEDITLSENNIKDLILGDSNNASSNEENNSLESLILGKIKGN